MTKLTEKEALKQAKDEGIEFVDHYQLFGEDLSPLADERFDTPEDAKAYAKEHKIKKFNLAQVRERKSENAS